MQKSVQPQTTKQNQDRDAAVQINDEWEPADAEPLMISNDIENIVHRLPEVGTPITDKAERIKDAAAHVQSLFYAYKNAMDWLEKDRKDLLGMVKRNYVNSEIEHADTLKNLLG